VNLHRLTGGPPCGLADSIQVLPDGAVLPLARTSLPNSTPSREGQLSGFTAMGGFDPESPPPDPPGTGMSAQLWGSRNGGAQSEGAQSRGALTSPWFVLPPLGPAGGVAVSVSGRTDRGNKLILEFGRSVTGNVAILGNRTPFDRVRHDQDDFTGPPDYREWRSIGLDAAQIPPGADRVRIHAIDDTTDSDGWLAVTGPRLRSVVGLTTFLAHRGPVLVAWPQAFLFPCVHNIVRVGGGLAGAPRVVIEAPRRLGRLSAITTDQSQGGDFAAIRLFGRLYEVPTRLAGHPEIDWGALQLSADPSARDTYQHTPVPRHGDISGSDRVR
ncbi:MAG: arabinosyltransferase C-terminal domain-containing protein, partial [Pseudonocardiaceae bacterium]